MKRNLAILLIMTSAALAQTATTVAVKPSAKPSAATVKAQPAAQANSVKASAAPASKPAAVSVQPAPAKPSVNAPAKIGAVANAPAKPATASPKAGTPVVAVKPAPAPAKAAVDAKAAQPVKKAAELKAPAKEIPKAAVAGKVPGKEAPKSATVQVPTQTTVAVHDSKETDKKPASKTISAVGRRDPFVSPVVKLGTGGSGCSSGKRCLAIDQIALKGVVKADAGMIAVVVNATNKAYFLRENDPVFNGYVTKITGDSIVFKETFHDRLGKPLTRDVTKTIPRPAV